MPVRTLLAGGDRRSIGRANEIAVMAATDPVIFNELIELLHDPHDPLIRMRAADAAEKASRANPQILVSHKGRLLALLARASQPELRWHLALLIPRLELTPPESRAAVESLKSYLSDRSAIVKTNAMQALADLVARKPSLSTLRLEVTEQIRSLAAIGTPAMRARGKRLLLRLSPPTA